MRLSGAVPTRPRALNPVGIHVMAGRSIPVFIGDIAAGVAITEHCPDVSSNEAVFDAMLDPAIAPATWHGKRVPFELVEHANGWPGPAPVRIIVAPDAMPY